MGCCGSTAAVEAIGPVHGGKGGNEKQHLLQGESDRPHTRVKGVPPAPQKQQQPQPQPSPAGRQQPQHTQQGRPASYQQPQADTTPKLATPKKTRRASREVPSVPVVNEPAAASPVKQLEPPRSPQHAPRTPSPRTPTQWRQEAPPNPVAALHTPLPVTAPSPRQGDNTPMLIPVPLNVESPVRTPTGKSPSRSRAKSLHIGANSPVTPKGVSPSRHRTASLRRVAATTDVSPRTLELRQQIDEKRRQSTELKRRSLNLGRLSMEIRTGQTLGNDDISTVREMLAQSEKEEAELLGTGNKSPRRVTLSPRPIEESPLRDDTKLSPRKLEVPPESIPQLAVIDTDGTTKPVEEEPIAKPITPRGEEEETVNTTEPVPKATTTIIEVPTIAIEAEKEKEEEEDRTNRKKRPRQEELKPQPPLETESTPQETDTSRPTLPPKRPRGDNSFEAKRKMVEQLQLGNKLPSWAEMEAEDQDEVLLRESQFEMEKAEAEALKVEEELRLLEEELAREEAEAAELEDSEDDDDDDDDDEEYDDDDDGAEDGESAEEEEEERS